ncbi:hypothetical protein [Rufibacter latericius]|uniref:Lipoprotein n=1 Tax=Rufibacter latericius TaxID=2487040 RepID=A0A3M9MV84_9BACT|nr:hypothetical protein [Rufibacter latericius]RNI28668.1 hypothetical protein EFB08_08500 [Rufibacter latericius]
MKKIHLLLLLVATSGSLCFTSCSSDDDGEDPAEDPCGLKDETEAFEKAVDAYYKDQSKANCQAYKKATVDYLEAARECDILDAETREELEETLVAVTSDLDCDE